MATTLAIKIDADTEIGTRIGIPNLLHLLLELHVPATFYFSLGPDNTGRALRRIFRKGFFKKCARTNVVANYGIRTLLNGVLFPGPHIGRKHAEIMRMVKTAGFEVGIHTYDHQKWQNEVATMSQTEIATEWHKAATEFHRIFAAPATTAASPGWQANEKTLAVYEQAHLTYASDCRGTTPFFPKIGNRVFKTLQIPTTLPTLDELLGTSTYSHENLSAYYLSLLKPNALNVLTIHPELEGRKYLPWFRSFITTLQEERIQFHSLNMVAQQNKFPICLLKQAPVTGRAGTLAMQGAFVDAMKLASGNIKLYQ